MRNTIISSNKRMPVRSKRQQRGSKKSNAPISKSTKTSGTRMRRNLKQPTDYHIVAFNKRRKAKSTDASENIKVNPAFGRKNRRNIHKFVEKNIQQ